MILEKYKINKKTLALLPVRDVNCQTLVIRMDNDNYVQKDPFEVIKESCEKYLATYEGRRKVVKNQLGYQQKVVIPVWPRGNLFFFPTRSPKSPDNCWINGLQIDRLHETGEKGRTKIEFINGRKITVDVSKYVLNRQIERTFRVHFKYTQEIKELLNALSPYDRSIMESII